MLPCLRPGAPGAFPGQAGGTLPTGLAPQPNRAAWGGAALPAWGPAPPLTGPALSSTGSQAANLPTTVTTAPLPPRGVSTSTVPSSPLPPHTWPSPSSALPHHGPFSLKLPTSPLVRSAPDTHLTTPTLSTLGRPTGHSSWEVAPRAPLQPAHARVAKATPRGEGRAARARARPPRRRRRRRADPLRGPAARLGPRAPRGNPQPEGPAGGSRPPSPAGYRGAGSGSRTGWKGWGSDHELPSRGTLKGSG